jgi:hypothetical protein
MQETLEGYQEMVAQGIIDESELEFMKGLQDRIIKQKSGRFYVRVKVLINFHEYYRYIIKQCSTLRQVFTYSARRISSVRKLSGSLNGSKNSF